MPGSTDSLPVQTAEPAIATHQAPQRDLYIDRLRSIMTALVIFHHTAITYGAIGGWFWREIPPSGSASSRLLILFCTTNQAYFMGFFFLLAGYFTPASLQRKGYAQFLGDRFLRLGLPLLAFGFFLGPLTAAIVSFAQGNGFWSTFAALWHRRQFINGPLWFAQALLIFSLVYCAWCASFGGLTQPTQRQKPLPAYPWWLLSAIAAGALNVAIRQFVPVGKNVFGLQLAYFAPYIFLFAIGIAAWPRAWIRQITWKNALAPIITFVVVWPLMPIASVIAAKLYGSGHANFLGGFTWPAILYSFWDPFVAWGLIAAWLLIARAYLNRPSPFWTWLNRRAYAVYIIHPPVLVGIALLLHPWVAPALLKFAVTGTIACISTWLISDPLVRLPGVRRIV
jgi:peptidoglycan/LPS O-acetylase OafA/YrhL